VTASPSTSAGARPPAHRPSRRHEIIYAATTVFARKGFAETSIQDIADEADVVPTAIYYHFAGKDELYEAALRRAITMADAAVSAARGDEEPADVAAVGRTTDAAWDWAEANPDEAALLNGYLPGTTRGSKLLHQEFRQRHIVRAFDYFEGSATGTDITSATVEHGARTLAARALIDLTISIHILAGAGGPLNRYASRGLKKALREVAQRMVGPDDPGQPEIVRTVRQ
jgi:AcrR family transcriptional regulator